jgi:hypothetical protein
MNEPPIAPPVAEYKDRSVGLILFGTLLLLVGGFCALIGPLTVFGQMMGSRMSGTPPEWRVLLPSLVMYPGLAVAFIWLGIGSLKARRWARAILLVLAWGWLASGVIASGFMAMLLPKFAKAMQAQGNISATVVVMASLITIMVVAYLLLPGSLVLFYRSRHVKATCEARSPQPSWTDGCPLPVLGLSVWSGLAALMMLMSALVYNGIFPLYGRFLSGFPGMALGGAVAVAFAYSAWASYHRRAAGWWTLLLIALLGSTSAALTIARVDLEQMYRLMGYSEAMINQMQQYNFWRGTTLVWIALVWLVPVAGYLFYVRKFFRHAAPAA